MLWVFGRFWPLATVLVLMVLATAGPARAETPPLGPWLDELRRDALAAGIAAATFDRALGDFSPDPRVIEADQRQPEMKLTTAEYLQRVAPPQRIERARRAYAENRAVLDRIARQYGVPARFIVALWGIESDFGRLTGKFPVIRSLATLAHEGRRAAFFRAQLIDALTILDSDHVPPEGLIGSWAGAMGQCQFIPSSFRKYAADGDGDGRRDIWTTRADVFASIANYLRSVGWNNRIGWGRPVRVPSGLDPSLVAGPRKPLAAWGALGLRTENGSPLPQANAEAMLVQPDGPGTQAYLVYPNFDTLLDWNRSRSFAIAVGMIADGIGHG